MAGFDISFHGGTYKNNAILSGTVNLYHLFIGPSSAVYNPSTPSVNYLQWFSSGLSGSDYAGIMHQYTLGKNKSITGATKFKFVTPNAFNYTAAGKKGILTDTIVLNTVAAAINHPRNGWRADPNGIYVVVFDGSYSYFSTHTQGSWNVAGGFCGFHQQVTINGVKVVISPIGDTTQASTPTLCAGMFFGGLSGGNYHWTIAAPNANSYGLSFAAPNDPYADAMISTLAHEIGEAVTDTNNGWYVSNCNNCPCSGYEVGDICQTYFNEVHTDATAGWNYNLQLGNYYFLVQTLWLYEPNGGSTCSMSTSTAPPANFWTAGTMAAVAIGCFAFVACCCGICYFRRRSLKNKELEANNIQLN